MTPQTSQAPRSVERPKPMNEITLRPRTCGPDSASTPMRADPITPPTRDERDDHPVGDDVEAPREDVETLVAEPDLDLAVAQLLEDVGDLIRGLGEDASQGAGLLAGSCGHPPRGEALDEQPAGVGLRHLEDVEVGVELDPDGGEHGDRLVEQHEPRGQP